MTRSMHFVSSVSKSTRIGIGALMVVPVCGLTIRTFALHLPDELTIMTVATTPVKRSPPPIAPTTYSGDRPVEGCVTGRACCTTEPASGNCPAATPDTFTVAFSETEICDG